MTDATSSSSRKLSDEESRVRQNRYLEAIDAGLSHDEADIFAVNGTDIGLLRKLVGKHVEPKTIAGIVI